MKQKEKRIIIILIIMLILIDQMFKIVLKSTGIQINIMNWMGFGVAQIQKNENNVAYILISLIAIMSIFRYINSNNTYIKMDSKIILSFSIAGAISNAVDRMWAKGVINYINFSKFSSINLSYIFFIITWIGMAIILTRYTGDRIKEKRNKIRSEKRINSK